MIKQALEAFIANEAAFAGAVRSSTIAATKGCWYSVELFQDGRWELHWSESEGREHAGVMLQIPALSDEEWADMESGEVDMALPLAEIADQLRAMLAEDAE